MITAVDDLRGNLLSMNTTSYDAIDKVMKKIAKDYNITTTTLHKNFVKRYKMIPDDWIKKVNLGEGCKKKTFVEFVNEASAAWQRKDGKNPEGGLNSKGIASYRKENPGSKLSLAVATPPSKLNPDSKKAKRRRSFCARMSGMPGPMKDEKGTPTRKALSLRKWNC